MAVDPNEIGAFVQNCTNGGYLYNLLRQVHARLVGLGTTGGYGPVPTLGVDAPPAEAAADRDERRLAARLARTAEREAPAMTDQMRRVAEQAAAGLFKLAQPTGDPAADGLTAGEREAVRTITADARLGLPVDQLVADVRPLMSVPREMDFLPPAAEPVTPGVPDPGGVTTASV